MQGYEVHAADVTAGDKLQALQCRLHVLDVRSPESIAAFAAQLEGKRIDVSDSVEERLAHTL